VRWTFYRSIKFENIQEKEEIEEMENRSAMGRQAMAERAVELFLARFH